LCASRTAKTAWGHIPVKDKKIGVFVPFFTSNDIAMTIFVRFIVYLTLTTGRKPAKVMEFGIIGTSIWQQNLPLMERLTLSRDGKASDLQALKEKLGVAELVNLATCNRVEFMYTSDGQLTESQIFHRLLDFFFKGKKDIGFFPNDFYHFTGKDAITHLFRTAASLESLVVGETQIVGQIKQAQQEAQETNLSGPALNRLIDEALLVAKRVKRETSIGVGALSMASLAVNELRTHLGSKGTATIALVGSGPMTRKMAAQINDSKLGRLLFVNRTLDKVLPLVEEFGGQAVSLADFLAAPGEVSAIISATASSEPVFDSSFVGKLPASIAKLLCIDLAVPRDFCPDLMGHERVILADIPHLKSRGNGNLRQKFVEAGKANEIVREAVANYLSAQVEISLKPIFHDSYQESMALAQRALDSLFNKELVSLGDAEREAVTRLVTKLVGHSSFQPVKALSGRLASLNDDLATTDLTGPSRQAI
jgi:glutamyl-tRNA reductase